MTLTLPSDVAAERVVVGCAIDSPEAARHAEGLELADFTVVDHRRLWTAARACSLPFRCDGSRTRAIANAAGVPFEVAEELRAGAPVLHDRGGTWSDRVRDATTRRRLLAEVADLHDAIGAGATLGEAVDGLVRGLEVAAGDSVGVLAGPESLVRS